MEQEIAPEKRNFIDKILDKKAVIFVFVGFVIRIIMLFYYYYTHTADPTRGWGDVGLNFRSNIYYPPLTIIFLDIFRFLSFGSIEVFAFWGFFWDILTSSLFYFVLKRFRVEKINYAFGLFLLNPFWFLNNAFSLENAGYHITDSFFFLFLFLAFMYYPLDETDSKYPFYIFIALSICAKYYTMPAIGLLGLKYLLEKNWKELKTLVITVVPIVSGIFLIPMFFRENYFEEMIHWYGLGEYVPIYFRVIPIIAIFSLFIIFRLRKDDALIPFECIIVSIVGLGSFLIFSYPYIRWFQSAIFYGIVMTRVFFTFDLNLGFVKRKIIIDNHALTFLISCLACVVSIIMIIFVLGPLGI